MQSTIHQADVVKWLRGNQWLVQNGYLDRYHAVICDPPYALEFMGRAWDAFDTPEHYQEWVTEWGRLLLDFVYPGAILMAFGGTRTYHRLAAGLEDAGWIIADSMVWMYGSGFPKAADIGKMIDKEAGAERNVVGEAIYADGKTRPAIWTVENSHDGWKRPAHENYIGNRTITAPATKAAQSWDGYKTALKPAFEPIVIARAPRAGHTFAQLAQRYGTGAFNVDAGRVDVSDDYAAGFGGARYGSSSMPQMGGHQTRPYVQRAIETGEPVKTSIPSPLGRYPANTILVCTCTREDGAHDDGCPVAELDRQSGSRRAGGSLSGNEPSDPTVRVFEGGLNRKEWESYDDFGGASRFFYCAKASTGEREWGLDKFTDTKVNDGRATPIDNAYQRGETPRQNVHPTVKPVQLIEYFARLILPPELDTPRRILIPFSGSGSEMIGAQLAGWDVIEGIEREAEYIEIARARLAWWSQFKSYEQARKTATGKAQSSRKSAAEKKPSKSLMPEGIHQLALF